MTDYPEAYQALRVQLPIDWLDLDNEIMKMPVLVQEAAELAVAASNEESILQLGYDVAKAETGQRLRQENERITEAAIERQLPLSDEVQQARLDYLHAKSYARLCEELVRSLRIKSQQLQKSCDMIVQGYMTPSAAYEKRRSEISAARRSQT